MKILFLLPLVLLFFARCSTSKTDQSSYVALTGATVIDGEGHDPIVDCLLLIYDGRIVDVGPKSKVQIPEGTTVIDVSGKTIIPSLINVHAHVGDVKGIETGHYSAENIKDNLSIYARYGVTTVISLGGDKKDAERVRAVNDSTSKGLAHLFVAGKIIETSNPKEALAILDSNHNMGVDFIKIRVDDQLGTTTKMSETSYRAVVRKAHELGYKVAAHIYYLDDAKKVLQAGVDLIAHSVRDLPIDEEFIQLMKEKKASYCPTLTRELSTFIYGDTASFFRDPFFKREYDSLTIAPLLDPEYQLTVRNKKSSLTYRRHLPVAMANLKKIQSEGIPVVFGTDSGVATRFPGYFEHLEIDMMLEGGLTPMQVIVSSSKTPAEQLGLKDLGTLSPGHHADFLILDGNPLNDPANFHKLSAVYIDGQEVAR